MASADQLVKLMFSWIEQRENCAKQLKKLADELKSLRAKCNAAECVGSTVSVVGAASLIGAGVATLLTAGAAAPALALAGGVYGGVGLTVSVTTKIIEHFSSSATLKEAQKIEKKGNKIAENIQKQFEQLKAEVKKMYPSADSDEVDRHVMSAFMGAVARRSGLKLNIDFSTHERFYHSEQGTRLIPVAVTAGLTAIVCGILAVFLLKTVGKQSKLWMAEATKQLIKETSSIGLKTALKGGVMVVGGAVGLGFALDEAIDNWKDQIKNNHETEASRSMRDTADDIQKLCSTARKQFDDMRTALEEMDRRQREEEENRRQREEEENRRQRDQSEQTGDDQGDEERDDEDKERDQEEEESDSEEETEEEESDDQCETNQTPPGTIRLGLLNVQSMNNKIPQILKLITQNNLDVFLTTETWLQYNTAETVLSSASPKDFRFHSQQREGRGGGVAIQFSKELQGKQLHFDHLNIASFEFVVTVVQHKWDQPVVIINLYRPPGNKKEEIDTLPGNKKEEIDTLPGNKKERFRKFLDEFQSLLDEVKKNYSSIIVTGDFNIHVNDKRKTSTVKFNNLLLVNDLEQHVEVPTHRGGNTLDLVITTNVEVSGLVVRDDGISDHYTVYFNAKPKDTRKKTKRNKNDEQTQRFKKTEE
ncbi:uncharacterized protein [Pagrus major]|uniref:uncharacterized protein n=1 Tax=Pagrus major TaxID=143350 RepID=UPI003CC899FF